MSEAPAPTPPPAAPPAPPAEIAIPPPAGKIDPVLVFGLVAAAAVIGFILWRSLQTKRRADGPLPNAV